MNAPRLDWNDRDAVAAWLEGLRASLADLDHVATDMLRPHRRRLMGHAMHVSHIRATRGQLRDALAFATPEPDTEHETGPAGSGGSPAF